MEKVGEISGKRVNYFLLWNSFVFAFKAPKGRVGGPTFLFAADLIFVLFAQIKDQTFSNALEKDWYYETRQLKFEILEGFAFFFSFFIGGICFRIWIQGGEMWLPHLQLTDRYLLVSISMDILPRESDKWQCACPTGSFIYGKWPSLHVGKY
jgi:hypothetical protein